MKIFHLGDLHLGKVVHGISMTDADQPFWIKSFLEAVDVQKPDAVVIAGDIYDRKIPSPEAMELFDALLSGLAQREVYVLAVPGNHDSAQRLAHVSGLLQSSNIFIAGRLKRDMMHVTINDGQRDVTFWLMPYLFPAMVGEKNVLDRDDLASYNAAAKAYIEAQAINPEHVNVLVAHQNVLASGLAPEHSGSESLVGGLGEIDYSVFDVFDYVALGHIHNEQAMGRQTLRYAGCPLYYDFSEVNREKKLLAVDINGKEDITISKLDIQLLHRMKQLAGTVDEIIEQGKTLENKEGLYIQAVVRDKHIKTGDLERMKEMLGANLINIKREIISAEDRASELPADGGTVITAHKRSIMEEFDDFYQTQENELLDEYQEKLIAKIAEQQDNAGDWLDSEAGITEADTEELVQLLLEAADSEMEGQA